MSYPDRLMKEMVELEKSGVSEISINNTWTILQKLKEWFETENIQSLHRMCISESEDDIILQWLSDSTFCSVDHNKVHIYRITWPENTKSHTYTKDYDFTKETNLFFADLKDNITS